MVITWLKKVFEFVKVDSTLNVMTFEDSIELVKMVMQG